MFILFGEVWAKIMHACILGNEAMPHFKHQYIGLTKKFCASMASFINALPFPLLIKSGLYLFVIVSIHDTSVVTLSHSVVSIVQTDCSTDTPRLMHQLHSRKSGTNRN